jgi:hypothetical protein
MSSIESYDGLCGLVHHYSSSDKRVRCNFEFGHSGPHSWDKKKLRLCIQGGSFRTPGFPLNVDNKRKKVVIGIPDDMSDKTD